jgi:hypothetical protein
VVSFTLWPLFLRRKSSPYPLDRRQDGLQSRSERGGGEKNSQLPPGIGLPNPDFAARSQSLYRTSYPGSPQDRDQRVISALSERRKNCSMESIVCTVYAACLGKSPGILPVHDSEEIGSLCCGQFVYCAPSEPPALPAGLQVVVTS